MHEVHGAEQIAFSAGVCAVNDGALYQPPFPPFENIAFLQSIVIRRDHAERYAVLERQKIGDTELYKHDIPFQEIELNNAEEWYLSILFAEKKQIEKW